MTKGKVAFHTLGCKVNQYETEAMRELFLKAGYDTAGFDDMADVYIINTCSVTGMGESKSRQFVSRARRKNPDAVIGVVGCYPQHSPKEVLSLPGVSFVAGTAQRSRIVELAEQYMETRKPIDAVAEISHEFESISASAAENRTRAYIKIQDGCENFCAYCIIPYTRGPRRSRPLASIADEARRLCDAGFKELVLTGIHIASYGCDLGLTLSDAVGVVCREGFLRVRLGSLEPGFISEEFLRDVSQYNTLCPHFHLSLQSGSETVLSRMERKYTPEIYRRSVGMIKSVYPEAGITADVMVGFPQETEEEHAESMRLIRELKLSRIHVFVFSPRPGTKADLMAGQIEKSVKERRSHEMQLLGCELEHQFADKLIGSCCQVLFETKGNGGFFEGYTDNYVRVKAPVLQGSMAKVEITGRQGECLVGRPVGGSG